MWKDQIDFLYAFCHVIAGTSIGEAPRSEVQFQEETLFHLCHEHQIIPIVYYYRRQLQRYFPSLSPSFFDNLKRYLYFNTARSIVYKNFLKQFSRELLAAGVQFCWIKGVINGLLFYPRYDLRSFSDLDIVVHPEYLSQVHALLLEKGFTLGENLSNQFPLKVINRYAFARHYERKTAPEIMVDLHVNFTNKLAPFQFNLEKFFQMRDSVEINGVQVPTLTREALFLIQLHHAYKHYYFRLIWFIDLYLLSRQPLKMEWIREQILELKMERLFLETCYQFETIFGDVPKQFWHLRKELGKVPRLFSFRDIATVRMPYTPSIGRIVISLKLLSSFKERMKYILTQLFPPPDTIAEFYSTDSSTKTTFYRYLCQRIKTLCGRAYEYLLFRRKNERISSG